MEETHSFNVGCYSWDIHSCGIHSWVYGIVRLTLFISAFLHVQVAKEDYNLGSKRERLMQRRQESSLGERLSGEGSQCRLLAGCL